jgi:hypothetical protein
VSAKTVPSLAIELSDAGLVAVHESRGVLPGRSPGYALVSGSRTLVGEEAERRLRHEPRSVHHRFWQGLDVEPLDRPFPRELSTADLVHAHLSRFWQRVRDEAGPAEPVALAVPGAYDRRQLGLLLAVAREAGIPVQGLVDLAVAGTADALEAEDEQSHRVLHMAMGLHRTVITSLACGPGLVRRERVSLVEVGWHELRTAWARHLAALFVKTTRFDPLHHATSEGQLHERQRDWLDAVIGEGEAEATLEARGRRYRIDLAPSDFTRPLRDAYSRLARAVGELAAGERGLLLLEGELARLPELGERLESQLAGRVVPLAEGAAGRAALLHSEQVMHRGEALPLVRSLQVGGHGGDRSAPEAMATARPPGATHVMIDGLARALGDEPFVLAGYLEDSETGAELSGLAEGEGCVLRRGGEGMEVETRGVSTLLLNGRPVAGAARLAPGDRLDIGGHTVWVVAVEEDGA